MATKQRSRRNQSRDRGPRYVAPVLDPTWQNPYAPSTKERDANLRAGVDLARRKSLPLISASVILAVVVVVLAIVTSLYALIALDALVLGGGFLIVRRVVGNFTRQGTSLGTTLLDSFKAGGTPKDRQRLVTVLDRLAATFGVDNISAFIIADPAYNACLVANGASYSFFVTSALMSDFELIELEGVVAHCLARQRLGLIGSQGMSSAPGLRAEERQALGLVGSTYRADEVAGAAIRYPLGIAGALHRCARQVVPRDSYFTSPNYDVTRWVWFDVHSDRATNDLGDLDDVELRALALEEW